MSNEDSKPRIAEYQRIAARDGAMAPTAWASDPRIAAAIRMENPTPTVAALPPIDNRRANRSAIERAAFTEMENEERVLAGAHQRETSEQLAAFKVIEGTAQGAATVARVSAERAAAWQAESTALRARHAAALDVKLKASKLDDAAIAQPLTPTQPSVVTFTGPLTPSASAA